MVVGASGAIGTRLIPQLSEHGHQVIGTFRTPERRKEYEALGAQPVALDLLDSSAVNQTVLDIHPDAIIHEATDLANAGFSRSLDKTFAGTNRLRTEGTDNLLAAAREAGVQRLVAQSFAPYRYIREGSMIKAEDDALDPNPPKSARETFAAMTYVDQAFLHCQAGSCCATAALRRARLDVQCRRQAKVPMVERDRRHALDSPRRRHQRDRARAGARRFCRLQHRRR